MHRLHNDIVTVLSTVDGFRIVNTKCIIDTTIKLFHKIAYYHNNHSIVGDLNPNHGRTSFGTNNAFLAPQFQLLSK